MQTILVTGGCGFIGSHFVRLVLESEPRVQVVNLDALTYAGSRENLAEVEHHPRYRFVEGDIADARAVRPIVSRGVSAILNFAAESHVERSLRDAGPFLRTNVIGTHTLLEAAREFGVERFVQVSTDEVYGSLGSTGLFTEDSPIAPNNPYAASKASADLLVRGHVQAHGVPAIITRCSNNFGPNQHCEKLIPRLISQLLQGELATIHGDGLQVRDWLHVRDHCAAVMTAWKHGRVGEVYNVGGRCERTVLDLAQRLVDLLGLPRSRLRHVADRPAQDRRYALDSTKIERELGWQPQVGFDAGLRETVRWYTHNAAWLDKLRAAPRRDIPLRSRKDEAAEVLSNC
jgi:dTDP-glucose 4,6-dehydratase